MCVSSRRFTVFVVLPFLCSTAPKQEAGIAADEEEEDVRGAAEQDLRPAGKHGEDPDHH